VRQLQRVLWTKGTFLTPQHLQLQDKYVENLLHFQLESLAFCPWGFATLRMDENKLLEGQVALSQARGIFPDGLFFDAPEADELPPSRTITDLFSEQRKELAVYLSIPEQRDNGINVGTSQGTRTRFLPELRMVRDENSEATEKAVHIARKNFKFLVEGENQEGSSVLQIAVVEKMSGGTYRLSPRFIPPMIDIHGSDYLRGILRGLVETLSARASALASTRRQKNQSLADFTVSDVASFWLLYTINYHLPLFRHLFHCRVVQPEQLFSTMLSLAGGLTTFSTTVAPRDLPAYDHGSLGKCFPDLEKKIMFLLETVIPVNYISLPLKLVQPSLYATSIHDDKYLHDCRMYLAVSADISDSELISRAPAAFKVGAAGNVDEMIRQALPGLKITYLASPPPEIPVKLKYKYFSLELTGKVWEGVQRARNLAVYVPSDFPQPQLELVILLPKSREIGLSG
jgi:type VI secretion system protein ImpJ